jgi:hypothetical protein
MSLSPNMTDVHLAAVMKALPDELDEAELCALTLTLYSAFIDDTPKIIHELIIAIYCFGESRGISSDKVSLGLRRTADMYDAKQTKQTAH